MKCQYCKCEIEKGGKLKMDGKIICRICAHNHSRQQPMGENEVPCPIIDGNTGEVIPYGRYPNIDWS